MIGGSIPPSTNVTGTAADREERVIIAAYVYVNRHGNIQLISNNHDNNYLKEIMQTVVSTAYKEPSYLDKRSCMLKLHILHGTMARSAVADTSWPAELELAWPATLSTTTHAVSVLNTVLHKHVAMECP